MHLLAALCPFLATPLNTFAHFIRRVAKGKIKQDRKKDYLCHAEGFIPFRLLQYK